MPPKGLFETLRCTNGRVFAQSAHLSRLIRSCPVAGIKPPERALLELALRSIIREKHLKNARLRLKVVRMSVAPQVIVSAWKLTGQARAHKGFSVLLSQEKAFHAGRLSGIKSLDRRFYERLFRKARDRGYDEAIFCDRKNRVVEGTRTNVFIVRGKTVLTPSLDSGCLPGITRHIVLGLLKRRGLRCLERSIRAQELAGSDEIFLTNSVLEIVAVLRLNNKKVGAGAAGPVTRLIARAYQKEVEKACGLPYNADSIDLTQFRIGEGSNE